MCAAVGFLLMSIEPWASTRIALIYCGCDIHACCCWCAADVHGAICCYVKSSTLLWMWHSCVLPLVCCWCPWSHVLWPEKLYSIVDVTLMCAAAGVLLMSLEPWAVTRKAFLYCGCDTHVRCRRYASDVLGALGCYHKRSTLFGMWHQFLCRSLPNGWLFRISLRFYARIELLALVNYYKAVLFT